MYGDKNIVFEKKFNCRKQSVINNSHFLKNINDRFHVNFKFDNSNNKNVTFGFCSKEKDEKFYNYLKELLGENTEIINVYGVGITKTLTQGLNEIINKASNDTVVLCHNDISFEECDKYQDIIPNIFYRLFEENEDYGIIGVIGGSYLSCKRCSWANGEINGHFIQSYKLKVHPDVYENHGILKKYDISLKESLILDGMLIALRKDRIKILFNEENNEFHFYDVEFCLQNSLNGVKIAVTKAILIHHYSEGDLKKFNQLKINFVNKYQDILPYYGNFNIINKNEKRVKLPFEETYVIHLVNEKERYISMMREFKKLGIEDEVNIWWTTKRGISNFIGNNSEQFHTPFYDIYSKNNENVYGNAFNCGYEHYQIIKNAYNRGVKSILIMEDDVIFTDDIDLFNNVMDNIPKDFVMLKFYYYPKDYGKEYINEYGENDDMFIDITNNPKDGTVCYAFDRKGIEIYLKYVNNKINIADLFYNGNFENKKIIGLNYKYNILKINETTVTQESTITPINL